ncbi:MAG: pyruvate kinase [bacterium]|nr:pyruvate kinase [bacterium]
MKKTRIIATYGPSVASPGMLSDLIDSGVNLFRINCSHGKSPDFLAASKSIRKASREKKGFSVGVLFDISGPKLRLDHFSGEIRIEAGERLTITTGKTDLESRLVSVNHPGIIKSVRSGERFFIDDGNLMFKILATEPKSIEVESINSGTILPGKGINLPDTDLKIETITKKDIEDITTAVRADADYIALSFVRSGNDIIEAKRIVKQFGGRQKVIAKLEKREAIENLENIMLLADGVMVARGDLGVELPPEELPVLQRKIISMANCHHKPVIVATQMLESMRFAPRATRAEINDVASAVFEHADAVMLSAETATGKYPLETVCTMARVIDRTEISLTRPDIEINHHLISSKTTLAIAEAVTTIDSSHDARAIFAFTTSGYTAEMISNLFPSQPVIALTPDPKVMTQLSLYRSVYPERIKQPFSFTEMIEIVNQVSRKKRLAKKGENVVITGGMPFGSSGQTNFMMIHEIGK